MVLDRVVKRVNLRGQEVVEGHRTVGLVLGRTVLRSSKDVILFGLRVGLAHTNEVPLFLFLGSLGDLDKGLELVVLAEFVDLDGGHDLVHTVAKLDAHLVAHLLGFKSDVSLNDLLGRNVLLEHDFLVDFLLLVTSEGEGFKGLLL